MLTLIEFKRQIIIAAITSMWVSGYAIIVSSLMIAFGWGLSAYAETMQLSDGIWFATKVWVSLVAIGLILVESSRFLMTIESRK